MNQKELAKQELIRWLSHPTELGKKPGRIKRTREFDYLGMKYYIFKFNDSFLSPDWMLGICGGYEEGATEHCGHLFSEFKEYNPATEKEDAIEVIERVRGYWIHRARAFENQTADKP